MHDLKLFTQLQLPVGSRSSKISLIPTSPQKSHFRPNLTQQGEIYIQHLYWWRGIYVCRWVRKLSEPSTHIIPIIKPYEAHMPRSFHRSFYAYNALLQLCPLPGKTFTSAKLSLKPFHTVAVSHLSSCSPAPNSPQIFPPLKTINIKQVIRIFVLIYNCPPIDDQCIRGSSESAYLGLHQCSSNLPIDLTTS